MSEHDTDDAPGFAVVPAFAQRLEPPAHLTPEQAQEWREIVDSLPGDYFRPGDVPLLAAFCVASALYKGAARMIQDEGMVQHDDRGRPFAHPAATILTSQASSLAQMAVKLRLCPSARYDAQKRQTKGKQAGAARPWEAVG